MTNPHALKKDLLSKLGSIRSTYTNLSWCDNQEKELSRVIPSYINATGNVVKHCSVYVDRPDYYDTVINSRPLLRNELIKTHCYHLSDSYFLEDAKSGKRIYFEVCDKDGNLRIDSSDNAIRGFNIAYSIPNEFCSIECIDNQQQFTIMGVSPPIEGRIKNQCYLRFGESAELGGLTYFFGKNKRDPDQTEDSSVRSDFYVFVLHFNPHVENAIAAEQLAKQRIESLCLDLTEDRCLVFTMDCSLSRGVFIRNGLRLTTKGAHAGNDNLLVGPLKQYFERSYDSNTGIERSKQLDVIEQAINERYEKQSRLNNRYLEDQRCAEKIVTRIGNIAYADEFTNYEFDNIEIFRTTWLPLVPAILLPRLESDHVDRTWSFFRDPYNRISWLENLREKLERQLLEHCKETLMRKINEDIEQYERIKRGWTEASCGEHNGQLPSYIDPIGVVENYFSVKLDQEGGTL